MITVYGVPGWGSTISELMLSLADIPYEVVDVEGFDQPGPARERLRQINPLCQVPTLRLADGSIMTETAAIALMILDQRPDLAPAPGTPQRPQFQRLLVWLVANVYPTFTYADYPERWAPAAAEQLVENCRQYRKNLYLWFEQQLAAGPVDLPFLMLTLMLASKGIAGVPRSSLVVLAATIPSFNIPVAGILLLMGIDHFLDMGRSASDRSWPRRYAVTS